MQNSVTFYFCLAVYGSIAIVSIFLMLVIICANAYKSVSSARGKKKKSHLRLVK